MGEVAIRVRLTPRGSKNEILGWDGDTLRIKVMAPPVEGAANKALVEFLAEKFGVKRGQVSIVSGERSREKTLRIVGLRRDEIRAIFG